MKKLLTAGIVILLVLMIIPSLKFGDKVSAPEIKQEQVDVVSTSTPNEEMPTNSASAIDAYLEASADVSDGSDLDDGSYATLSE